MLELNARAYIQVCDVTGITECSTQGLFAYCSRANHRTGCFHAASCLLIRRYVCARRLVPRARRAARGARGSILPPVVWDVPDSGSAVGVL